MIRFLSRVLLFGLCASLSATAYGQFARSSVLPTSRELAKFGLERAWWNQATVDAGTDRLVYLVVDEDCVYTQSRTGLVTAFDGESGRRLWSRLIGNTGAPSFPVVTNAEHLLLASGLSLFGINKFTGRLQWRLSLPHHPATAPGINDVQAFIGTLEGSVYAFDLATIRRLYEDQLLPEWSEVPIVWRYRAGGAITSPPTAFGAQVNFASEDGSLYSVDIDDGALRFQFETNGPIQAPIERNEDSIFIASDEVRLFCISAHSDQARGGKLRWSFVSAMPIRKQPQVVGPQLFVAAERGGLYALDAGGGRVMWHQMRATEFLAAGSESLFASDDLGHVLILSRHDGGITGALPLRGLSVRVPNDRTDRLYLASLKGLVVCLREQGSEFPEYHKFPERQPMLPEFADEQPAETAEPQPVEETRAP